MQDTPLFQKSYDFYRHLYENLRLISKRDRFAWGERSERAALGALMLAAKAGASSRENKRRAVAELSECIDALKILLRLGDDLNILDHKRYIARSGELLEIGKMVGGWLKSLG